MTKLIDKLKMGGAGIILSGILAISSPGFYSCSNNNQTNEKTEVQQTQKRDEESPFSVGQGMETNMEVLGGPLLYGKKYGGEYIYFKPKSSNKTTLIYEGAKIRIFPHCNKLFNTEIIHIVGEMNKNPKEYQHFIKIAQKQYSGFSSLVYHREYKLMDETEIFIPLEESELLFIGYNRSEYKTLLKKIKIFKKDNEWKIRPEK